MHKSMIENQINVRNIGNLIKSERKSRGMTQAEVASVIGVSTQHYSRIERGEYIPGLQTYLRLVDVLELDLSKLRITKESAVSSTMYEILNLLEKFNNNQQKAVLSFLKTMNPSAV